METFLANSKPKSESFDMPQIPFEVYDYQYGKTVKVVGSCDIGRPDSLTLYFSPSDSNIQKKVYKAVNKVFNKPGVTRVQVCRESYQIAESK